MNFFTNTLNHSRQYNFILLKIISQNPAGDPSQFIRLELLRIFAYFAEAVDFETFFAMPTLPLRFGQEMSVKDIYQLDLVAGKNTDSQSSNKFKKALYSNMDSVKFFSITPEAMAHRGTLLNSLVTSVKDVSIFLLNRDSIVSKHEPFLFMLFKFVYLNLTETFSV